MSTRMLKAFKANLSLRGRGGEFVCPLCLRPTPRNQIARAHVWPKALGGTAVALSCVACDNGLGTHIDADLSGFVLANKAGNGQATLKGVLIRPGGSTGRGVVFEMKYRPAPEGIELIAVARASNPRDMAELRSFFERAQTDWRGLTLELTCELNYARPRLRLALAHSAYLEMFRQFGYEWIDTDAAREIRGALATESPCRLPLWIATPGTMRPPGPNVMLSAVRDPAHARGFLVAFPQMGDGHQVAMWIPPFSASPFEPPEHPPGRLQVTYLDNCLPALSRRANPGRRLQKAIALRGCAGGDST